MAQDQPKPREPPGDLGEQPTRHRGARHGTARRRIVSPLTRRILTVNVLALGILVAGLLFLGQYEDSLVEAELESLATQGEIFAGALGQSVVGTRADGSQLLRKQVARPMLRRLVQPTHTRARLFAADGSLLTDSRDLIGPGGTVQVEELPPPASDGFILGFVLDSYEAVVALSPARTAPLPYSERADQRAGHYSEVVQALSGESAKSMRIAPDGAKVLIAAVPVQRFKKVLGALMLTSGGKEIENAVRDVRLGILQVFAVALGVTVLLSFYLAGAIARPVRRLAEAAERVRRGTGNDATIPDFTRRRDEIGELSGALRDMTAALWQRMVAVESFAADVAHEIKNPLTSLRSAVETVNRVSEPEQQRKLMSIIQDDVQRLDRLISDISSASRLDAELARASMGRIDIGRLLLALVQVHESTAAPDRPKVSLDLADGSLLAVSGIEGRLVQVFENLISNAFSFSPPGGEVRMTASRFGGTIEVCVDDDGPGLPEESLDSIFERFYSERPEAEQFGTHSGLGLSISRQIVEAHGGTITAANRYTAGGAVGGAHFTVRLPAA